MTPRLRFTCPSVRCLPTPNKAQAAFAPNVNGRNQPQYQQLKKLTPFHPSFSLMPENLKSTHKPAVNQLVILLEPPSTFDTASIPRFQSTAVAPADVIALSSNPGADGRLQPLNGVDPSQPPSGCGRRPGAPWMVALSAIIRLNELLTGVAGLPGKAGLPPRACVWTTVTSFPRMNFGIVQSRVLMTRTFETIFTCR